MILHYGYLDNIYKQTMNKIIENILNQIKDCEFKFDINNYSIDDDCIYIHMYNNYSYTVYLNNYSENANHVLFSYDEYDETKEDWETIIDLKWNEELNKYDIVQTEGYSEDFLRECLEYVTNDDYILWLCRQIR